MKPFNLLELDHEEYSQKSAVISLDLSILFLSNFIK